ncbi:hypothetical protein LEP3755_13020 [Leptolyngbya sp. NIES-3755]|nr:hypothetical protein LEP3755_13020 [Leptolyngbya sp. NIES-3755]
MSLNPSLLPVKKIKSSQARSMYPSEVIEQAANAILEAEGTINPIVVRQLNYQEFEVIDGHLEYHAAARAKELDLAGGEMIDAIVVEPENEAAILEQIRLLRSSKQSETPMQSTSDSSSAIKHRLTNLEKQIENQLGELNRKLLDLNQPRNSQQQMAELIHTTVSAVMKEQVSTIVQQIVQEVGTSRKKAIVPVEELEERVKTEGFEKLTAAELKSLAKGRGLTGYSSKRKADLIAFIKQSEV